MYGRNVIGKVAVSKMDNNDLEKQINVTIESYNGPIKLDNLVNLVV